MTAVWVRGPTVPGMTETGTDWRRVNGMATAWFEAPSLTAGAALAVRVLDLSTEHLIDLRASGLRVRLADTEHAEQVSAAARELGLTAHPAALQQLGVLVEARDPAAVQEFWQRVLAYDRTDGGLVDPLRRDLALWIRASTDERSLRNRLHVDVVRPAKAVAQLALGEATGPYGVCHTDSEGNEVDLVPGDPLTETVDTNWQAVFSAMACFRVSPTQQRELATAAAVSADEAGFPLMIDLRPGLVIMDSGKDLWEADAHGLDVDFTDLAERVQTAARELGAAADPTLPRFLQLFFDAADVPSLRRFWLAALEYVEDRREGASDIVDPRRLNPVLVFQELDVADVERRRQRSRIQLELAVPADSAAARVAAAVAAGGRVLDEAANRWRIADPEGNELVIVGGST